MGALSLCMMVVSSTHMDALLLESRLNLSIIYTRCIDFYSHLIIHMYSLYRVVCGFVLFADTMVMIILLHAGECIQSGLFNPCFFNPNTSQSE